MNATTTRSHDHDHQITSADAQVVDADAIMRIGLRDHATWIDVRTQGEFATGAISGSHNLPLSEMKRAAPVLRMHLKRPVVLVCQSGQRARQAAAHLHGHPSGVYVLEGGVGGWGDLVTPENPSGALRRRGVWSMERQVRGISGSIVLASTLASFLVWRPLGAIAGVIGAGLLFSAITNICAMAAVLGRLPYNRRPTTDLDQTLEAISAEQAFR